MRIYPAIDLKGGVCVRLKMGDMAQATLYGDPAEVAKRWQKEGAQYLHVVDLDAAFSGEFSNRETVAKILKAVSIPVQLGGGVRSMADIRERLAMGASRVILGTAAFEAPELITEAAVKYPGRIVAGIDAKDGRVATRGWAQKTKVSPVLLAQEMKTRGVSTIVYTDIARDGMLAGPNVSAVLDMVEKTGLEIIASGGMSRIGDVKALAQVGAAGVIIGKALYTGDIELGEAIRLGEETC
jgi:phosphoribosylformimino-5-aminoimidazole carboxamide ribotide isomerase